MPKGGYCEACGRWVWIAPDGSCEAGHPPDRIREPQQLMALSSPGGKPLRTPVRPKVVPLHTRFWWRHSWWIVLTLTFGILNWLAFVYVSLRARQPQWLAWGFVYLLPFAATIAAIGLGYFWYALAVQLVVAVVSFVHAVTLRPRYRALMFGDPPLGSVPAPPATISRPRRLSLSRSLDENVAQTLREAHEIVGEISDTANRLVKPDVRQAVGRLALTAEQILGEIQRRPERIDLARGFLTYYLEAAARIVSGYERLVTRENRSDEVSRTIAQAEASLPGIQKAFDTQLDALLQHDLLDLDSEIALLDKTVQMQDRFLVASTGRPASSPRASSLEPSATDDGSSRDSVAEPADEIPGPEHRSETKRVGKGTTTAGGER